MSYEVQIANSDEQIQSCFLVMHQLRPHLVESEFVERVREQMKEAYQLAFIMEEGEVNACAGFRISNNLFMGKNLYVDDLISAEDQRSKGLGTSLMTWLRELAKQEGCQVLHLDSGTHRKDAHRFYFREGMHIASYHFSEDLNQ